MAASGHTPLAGRQKGARKGSFFVPSHNTDYSVGLYEMEWDDVNEEFLPDFGQSALILAWSPMRHG